MMAQPSDKLKLRSSHPMDLYESLPKKKTPALKTRENLRLKTGFCSDSNAINCEGSEPNHITVDFGTSIVTALRSCC